MNKTLWIILGTIFIVIFGGAAGLLAVLLFHTTAPVPAEEEPRNELLQEAPPSFDDGDSPPPPVLRGTDTPGEDAMARRMAALEAEVKKLREDLAAERAKNKPLHDLVEQAEAAGMGPGSFEAGGPGLEVVGGPDHGGPLAAEIAKKLGLDAGRTKAFREAYERWLDKVEALEKEHAKVTVDGDTTTITIDRFGQAGDQLRREWDDLVEASLSADEKQAYDKQGARNRLVGSRSGDYARTITIKEAGGSIRVTQEADDGKGGKTHEEMQGPAMARDLMLQDYAHLLK